MANTTRNPDTSGEPEGTAESFQNMTAQESGPLAGNGDRAPMQDLGGDGSLAGNGDRTPS